MYKNILVLPQFVRFSLSADGSGSLGTSHRGGGMEEKMGASQFFLLELGWGGLIRSRGGLGGVFFNKSKKLSFAIFGILNAIRLGSGNFFA